MKGLVWGGCSSAHLPTQLAAYVQSERYSQHSEKHTQLSCPSILAARADSQRCRGSSVYLALVVTLEANSVPSLACMYHLCQPASLPNGVLMHHARMI